MMGKSRGASGKRRLADMTIHPPTPLRDHFPPEECEETPISLVLAAGNELTGGFILWQDRYMIEFAVVQLTKDLGRWVEVSRIDTDHNKIHKHQLRRGSQDRHGIVTDLVEIPPNEGWKVVDEGYTKALMIMENEWQENLRRWHGDPQ